MGRPESSGGIALKTEVDSLQMVKTDGFFGQSKLDCADQLEKGTNLLQKNPLLSINENEPEPSLWVDEYKCSLCGFELPLSFVEERQEHSDFHLADMLQKEESQHNSGNTMHRPRCSPKDQVTENRRKKQKVSPKKHKVSPKIGKHIPIDLFFVKSNQNCE